MRTQEDPVHYTMASFLPATGMLFQVPRNHDKEDIAHREELSVYKFDQFLRSEFSDFYRAYTEEKN